jgi:hypothetical protein
VAPAAGETPPETIARADVLAVALPARSGSLWAGLAAGGVTFAFIGFPAAIGLASEEECQPNCGGVMAKMALLMVGLPIGAGYLGYRTIGRRPQRVVYRAPTDS